MKAWSSKSFKASRPRLGLGLVVASALLWTGTTRAEDAPPVEPRVVIIGFEDLDDGRDCDEVVARYGRCIEEVKFRDLESVYRPHGLDEPKTRLNTWTGTYGWMWDDLSFRFSSDEVIEGTLVTSGVNRLPEVSTLFQSTDRQADTRTFAVPKRELWMDGKDWVTGPTPIFRGLGYHFPNGLVAPPPVVLMKGRFAERLVFDGRDHQFDIMDGDPESSGPFFEQMYPYDQVMTSRGSSGGDEYDEFEDYGYDDYGYDLGAPAADAAATEIPLSHFVADEQLKGDPTAYATTAEERRRALIEARKESYPKTLLSAEQGMTGLREMASQEFDYFYENVGVQIVRFAREEYTPTHLRVLTALMAMHDPPGFTDSRGLAENPNAGSEGQLDADEMLAAEADASASGLGFEQAFDLNYPALPKSVVERRLLDFDQWNEPPTDFLIDFTYLVAGELELLLRRRVSPFTALDDRSLVEWTEANAKPGRAVFVRQFLKPMALSLIVSKLDSTERDRVETSLLLDHVRYEFVSRFKNDPTTRQTPGELEGIASEQWAAVLQRHGFFANRIPDGPGTVDPLAVCTTTQRQAALGEPVFGPINIDQIVVAADGLTDPDAVLWQSRDQLPFLMFDDPEKNAPEITRLVSLPGERAIYRLRWNVWSGWHLLWAPDPVSVEEGTYRLALRTAALCDNMTLAPPDLVPTLVRAALLDGDFRPVNVIQGDGSDAEDIYNSKPVNQELYDGSKDTVSTSADAADLSKSAVENMDSSPGSATTDAISAAQKLGSLGKRDKKALVPQVRAESVQYVHDLVALPLQQRIDGSAGVLVVLDESHPREKRKVSFNKPRSPYLYTRSKAESGGYRYTAGWAYFLPPAESDIDRTLIAPAYIPTESVNTAALVQKWGRRHTGDWSVVGGLGMYPLRSVSYDCKEGSSPNPGTVPECLDDEAQRANTEGFTVDVSALRTIWTSSRTRWAIEFGPEFRLDVLHGGKSWFYNNDINYGWSFNYKGGVLAGLRLSRGISPLATNAKGFPWGARRPTGGARVGRSEGGLRVGAMLGPGFSGLELTGFSELWWGFAMRRKKARDASFTAFHPAILLGPYVRYSYTGLLVAASEPERYYTLNNAHTVYAGIRLHFRLNGSAAGDVPEVGK